MAIPKLNLIPVLQQRDDEQATHAVYKVSACSEKTPLVPHHRHPPMEDLYPDGDLLLPCH